MNLVLRMRKVLNLKCLKFFVVTEFKLGIRGRDMFKVVVITEKNLYIMPFSLENNGKEID